MKKKFNTGLVRIVVTMLIFSFLLVNCTKSPITDLPSQPDGTTATYTAIGKSQPVPPEDKEIWKKAQQEVANKYPLAPTVDPSQLRGYSTTGVNPTHEQILAAMQKAGAKYNIPVEVLWGIAMQESNLRQYTSSGTPLVSGDNGIGIMQVTPWAIDINFDENSLKYDYEYNIEAGAQVVLSKWNYISKRNPIGNNDWRVLENWYFTMWAYNGYSKVNNPNEYLNGPKQWCNSYICWTLDKPYQEKVIDHIKNKFGITITSIPKSLLPAAGTAGIPSSGAAFETPTPIHMTGNNTPPSAEDDPEVVQHEGYKTPLNPFAGSYKGYSFWYAWGRAYQKTGVKIEFSSTYNRCAKNWYSGDTDGTGKVKDLKRGTTAKAYSLVLFNKGDYGHVAFVEAVANGQIAVSEYDYNGDKKLGTRILSVNDSSIVGYIYLKDGGGSDTPAVPAPDLNNAGYKSSVNPFAENYNGYTFWYAYGRTYEKTGVKLVFSSTYNRWARNWYNGDTDGTGKVVGVKRGRIAIVDSIVIFNKGDYGHAAYIEAVNGDKVTISEYDFNGDKKYTVRTISITDSSIVGFIYVKQKEDSNESPAVTSPDLNNAGYKSSVNPFAENYNGYTFWYTYGRTYEKTAVKLVFSSSYNRWARNWYSGDTDGTGKIVGVKRGTTAKVDSIVIFNKGDYGHAAYVEAVNGNQITISEYDFNDDKKYTVRTISVTDSTIVGYIYVKEKEDTNTSPDNPEPALSHTGYKSPANPFAAAGYTGQCTWYAWGRAYEMTGVKLSEGNRGCLGNAKYWITQAKDFGLSTGSIPKQNSIIVIGDGTYGHVAYVEKVNADGTIVITEANLHLQAKYNGYRTINPSSYTVLGYIYPKN